jgi:Mn-dependent DtxR family transcriptional regulator
LKKIFLFVLAWSASLTLTICLTYLGVSERAAQEALHKLDDDGYVMMRNGWYRLSEAYKAGKL